MFTIKATRKSKKNPGGQIVKIYQAESVEIIHSKNTSFKEVIFPNGQGEELWLPVGINSNVDGTEEVDTYISMVVIENMEGKTTEVVKG